MGNNQQDSFPLLSIFESTPVLIPYFLAFFLYLGIFTNFPLYIQITQGISAEDTVNIWAIISGVALLIGALTRLPAGLISDRIGRKNGFYLAYLSYFTAMIAILFVEDNLFYLIAMGLIRFGSNMVAMTGRAVVSTASRDRGLKNGLLSSMTGLGSFIGPLSLGYVLDHFPPNTIFYVSIGIITLDLLLFYISFEVIERWFDTSDHSSDLNYSRVNKSKNVEYIAAIRTTGIPTMLFLFFAGGLAYGMIQSIYSIYGFNILFLSTTTIGLITGLASLSQTLVAPITGRLYVFIKDEYLRIISWGFFVLAGISAILSPIGVTFYIASFFLTNIGFASYFTMEITRMSTIVEESQFSFTFGIGTSLAILATSAAGFVAPILYRIGPEVNFTGALVTSIISLILVLYKTPKWLRERDH